MREPVDLADQLALFSEHWSPKVVARLNDYEIKVVKLKGEFVEPAGTVNTGAAGGELIAAYDDSLLDEPATDG